MSATRSARSRPSRSTRPGSTARNRADSAVSRPAATAGTGASPLTPITETTTSGDVESVAGGGASRSRVASTFTNAASAPWSAISSNCALVSRTSLVSRNARTVADRGASISSPSSPRTSPRPSSLRTMLSCSTCTRPVRIT
ncbi:Uncharacterised protein [Mycobacterium tuberculosis]|uniref:Uncharacterized protein n=1 Tax=Mycobacterium tuberculosis TaxID=1773 RepID=A0A916LDV5_MYCTX|nr:Uncharacterised protein [Mycobacterium tuberculosis]